MTVFLPTLALNADFQPLSYYPLSLWSWQDSIKAVFLDRVNILAEYEETINSPSISIRLPSVIALKEYKISKKDPAFTRFNVFLRDNFSCQYCGDIFTSNELTFDHVIPKSKGGETKWENVVAACAKCNLKKSDLLLKEVNMKLIKKPFTPTNSQLQVVGKKFPPNYLHKSWMDYVYWDSELEKN